MLNGIAAKAIIPVSCAVTGFVIVGCLLLHAYIRNDMIADTIRNEAGLAGTIVKSTRYAMLKTDREMLQQTIEDIGSQPGVEHVRIFNKRGVVMFSSDPGEIHRALNKHDAGCSGCHSGPVPATSLGTMEQARRFVDGRGHEVLAITAPVYNEASCVAAACHQGPSATKVLGTLDIGFSTAPLQAALSQLRWRLAGFCAMVLLLTVGGVFALLRRQVLLPVRELVIYAEEVADGKVESPEPKGSEEIAAVAAILRRQRQQLQDAQAALSREEPPPRR